MSHGAPAPLSHYAFLDVDTWYPEPSSVNYGMRISAIPIPAAAWLFGSGMLGLTLK